MSNSYLAVRVRTAVAVLTLLASACQDSSPGAASLREYKQNVPKFEEMLPRWSNWVGEATEKNFKDGPAGLVKGKVIFVGREYSQVSVELTKKLDPVRLYFKNENSDLHKAGLIAGSPQEVGTVIFVHTLIDQYKEYAGQKAYISHKFHVYVVDAATGEIKGTRELKVDKFDPPSSIKGSTILDPYNKLDQFIASLKRQD